MNANERPRLLQGIALIEEARWAIDGPSLRGIDPGIDVSRAPADVGGELYPNKPPGTTLPAAAAYAILRGTADATGTEVTLRSYTWWARLFGGLLPCLGLVAFMTRDTKRGPAWQAAVALYVLATPVLSYGRLLYGHQLAASLLFVGVLLLCRAMELRRPWVGGLGGLLAGLAVTVEYGAVFAGIPIAIFVIASARRPGTRTTAALAVAGALVPMVLLAGYHELAFGSPWTTPYHHVVRPDFADIHRRGLLGLALPTARSVYEHGWSPWGGLAYWAPLTIIAIAGGFWQIREGEARSGSILSLTILLTMVVVNVGLGQTGGWRVGPRYLVVALPFMVPGLAFVLEKLRSRPVAQLGVVTLAFWSVVINFLAANLFPHLIPMGSPVAEQLAPLWAQGLEPYNLLGMFGFERRALWVVAATTLGVAGWALWRATDQSRRTALAWAGGVCIAIVMIGVTVTADPIPEAKANLSALERMWEPRPADDPRYREPKRRVLYPR